MENNDKLAAAAKAIEVLTKWANLKGHDKCWHHPEVLSELCGIFGIATDNDPCLPSRSEFKEGCRKYQEVMYGSETSDIIKSKRTISAPGAAVRVVAMTLTPKARKMLAVSEEALDNLAPSKTRSIKSKPWWKFW